MIKNGQEDAYDDYELKNYYNLGFQRIRREDFTLRILDLSGIEVTSDYEFEVDYDFGILKFLSPLPPFPDACPPVPTHQYTIYLECKHAVGAYMLQPDIVPESERVYLDGRELTRDVDYFIDYSSGFITFTDPDRINEDSEIKVDYEWTPFAGGKATILGGRVEFVPGKRFSSGSTFLSQTSPRVREIPRLGSAPPSHQVMEMDAQLGFRPNLGAWWGKKIPLDIIFSGEIAKSTHNPNTFGSGMVEDFESTKITDELSMDKDAWQLSSRPDMAMGPRDELAILNEDVPGEDINPNWSRDERRVLVLQYDFFDSFWDSVVYPISAIGRDYSQMNYLELWIRGDGEEVSLHIDLGLVSEDIDGDWELDTEDKNGDGKLNPGEDTGIDLNGKIVGEGNGKLDTEDLDGDGILDTRENYSQYDSRIEPQLEIDWRGWRKITIPLRDGLNTPWDSVKSLVKHLRLWIEGDDISGELGFALIGISGDKWEKENLEIKAVNSYDDPEYNPFDNPDFRRYYEKMYGDSRTGEGKWRKEGALCLTYNLLAGDEGWVQQTFIKPQDYSDYRTLNFWIFGDNGEETFYLRLGSNVEEGGDYYQKELEINWNGWYQKEVPLREMEREGTPNLRNIKQLRAGIKNESDHLIDNQIYLNDIFLSEVMEKEGLARRISMKTSLGRSFSLTTEYKEMDDAFQKIGVSPSNQGLKLGRIRADLSPLSFLPLSLGWGKEERQAQPVREMDLSRQVVESRDYQVSFLLPPWPQLTFKGENSQTESQYLAREEKKIEDNYQASLKYENPCDFPLLPTLIQTTYQLKESVFIPDQRYENTRRWRINLPFQPLKNLSLEPGYSQSITKQRREGEPEKPKLNERSFSLASRASFFHLSPRLAFKGGYKEDGFWDDPRKRDVSTHSQVSLNLPIKVGEFFPNSNLWKSLNFYSTYEVKKEAIYEDTTTSLDFYSRVGLEEPEEVDLREGRIKSTLKRRNFSLKEIWQPFDFLNNTCSYNQLKEIRTREGTPYVLKVITWPSLDFIFNLNKTPLVNKPFQRFFVTSIFKTGYVQKESIKKGISSRQTYQPSLTWKGEFKKPRNFTLTLDYNFTRAEERRYGEERAARDFSSLYGLRMDYFVLLPWGMKIPLLNKIINFKNEVHLSSRLTLDTRSKYLSSGRVDKDNQKYNLFMDIEYKMWENVQMKLGLEGSYFEDRVVAGEDHYSYGASVEVEIRF